MTIIELVADEILLSDADPVAEFARCGVVVTPSEAVEMLRPHVVRCVDCNLWVFPESVDATGLCPDCDGSR